MKSNKQHTVFIIVVVLMYMGILLHVCPWSACMPNTHEGQKKVLDALLQLEVMTF